MMGQTKEPYIHSHITDMLDDAHPKAWNNIYCSVCREMLHAHNNECMQTWIEMGSGNFCVKCFSGINGVDVLSDEHGLK